MIAKMRIQKQNILVLNLFLYEILNNYHHECSNINTKYINEKYITNVVRKLASAAFKKDHWN